MSKEYRGLLASETDGVVRDLFEPISPSPSRGCPRYRSARLPAYRSAKRNNLAATNEPGVRDQHLAIVP